MSSGLQKASRQQIRQAQRKNERNKARDTAQQKPSAAEPSRDPASQARAERRRTPSHQFDTSAADGLDHGAPALSQLQLVASACEAIVPSPLLGEPGAAEEDSCARSAQVIEHEQLLMIEVHGANGLDVRVLVHCVLHAPRCGMAPLKALAPGWTNELNGLDACADRMYGAPMATPPARKRGARPRRPIQLSSLRGFEAAARRLSFTLAADELALTQSAISRQVATLERQVGKALFVRKTRALLLTPDGRRLHAAVTQALGGVDACVEAIRGVGQAPRISLTTYASFASLWLVPRLAAFQQTHPHIEFRIDASDRMVDLVAEGLDLAIRRNLPSRIDASDPAHLLCEEFVTPALSQQLLERSAAPLRSPQDLQRLPLIEIADDWRATFAASWQRWFEAANLAAPPAGGRMTFSFIDQAVQAAVRGQGVVLGHTPMLDDAVASGQLITPFPEAKLATGYSLYLIVNPQRAKEPEVTACTRWLLEEFARGPRRQT